MPDSEYQGDGEKLFPSPTAGSGRLRNNSARTGRGQGRGSARRMVKCAQCGFLVDSAKTARGGTYSGDGGLVAGASVTTTHATLAGPNTSDTEGRERVPAGGGCPLCGSRNFTT